MSPDSTLWVSKPPDSQAAGYFFPEWWPSLAILTQTPSVASDRNPTQSRSERRTSWLRSSEGQGWGRFSGTEVREVREHPGLELVPRTSPWQPQRSAILLGSCEHRLQYLKLRPPLKPVLAGQGPWPPALRNHRVTGISFWYRYYSSYFLTSEHSLITTDLGCLFLK